jgi:hypothetical protein
LPCCLLLQRQYLLLVLVLLVLVLELVLVVLELVLARPCLAEAVAGACYGGGFLHVQLVTRPPLAAAACQSQPLLLQAPAASHLLMSHCLCGATGC